jgi:hypothetical protein
MNSNDRERALELRKPAMRHLETNGGRANSPTSNGRSFQRQRRHVDTTVRPIQEKRCHLEVSITNNVSLADLDHFAKFGDTSPGCVEKRSGERIEDNVDAPAARRVHDTLDKGIVPRTEDTISSDSKIVDRVCDFFLRANGHVHLESAVSVSHSHNRPPVPQQEEV